MTNTECSRAGFAAALTIFAIAAMPATAQVTCANASLVGSYGVTLDGSVFPATGGPTFQKSIGLLTSDGQGLLRATLTTSVNGTVTPTAYTGSYSVQANCTGSMTLNGGSSGPLVLALGIGNGGQSAVLAGALSSIALSGTMVKASTGCSAGALTAGYNWESDGEVVQAGGMIASVSGLIDLQFDGRGGISGSLIRVQLGAPVTLSIGGSYNVNGDCTGTIHFTDSQGFNYNIAFVVIEGAARMLLIQTDATTVNAGVAVSTSTANSSGSIAQVASAGNWTTTITLVNNGETPAQAQLSFFDQNGSPLPLPLTFPQTPFSGVTFASTVSRTLNPDATLLIVTTGPNTQPTQTGWAQLISSGNVSGHAVFAQSVGSGLQEAVVQIETHNPAAFVLPFDNTAGYDTGVAVANISTSAANVKVIVRDGTGATLQTQTLTLPAQGQTSFNLASRYSQTVKKLGTVEFDTPAGGQISVLGLRFNPTGAFSTVPPLGE
jgi:hypothetical protein